MFVGVRGAALVASLLLQTLLSAYHRGGVLCGDESQHL